MAVAAPLQPKGLATPGEVPHCQAKAAAGACDAPLPALKQRLRCLLCSAEEATQFEWLADRRLQPHRHTGSLSRHRPVC